MYTLGAMFARGGKSARSLLTRVSATGPLLDVVPWDARRAAAARFVGVGLNMGPYLVGVYGDIPLPSDDHDRVAHCGVRRVRDVAHRLVHAHAPHDGTALAADEHMPFVREQAWPPVGVA